MCSAGTSENPEKYWETTSKKTAITESLPVQFSATVFALSKHCLLSYYYDIFCHYLKPETFEMHVTDTDSIIVALSSETLDECIREELLEEFLANQDRMFVPNEGPLVTFHSKIPLLLKVEGRGHFSVSLAPKSYFMLTSDGSFKTAAKGISRLNQNTSILHLKSFFDSLFDLRDQPLFAKLTSIKVDEYGNLLSYSQMHKVLTHLARKWHYCPRGVHYFPQEITQKPNLFAKIYPYPCTVSPNDAWDVFEEYMTATSTFARNNSGL